MDTRKDIKRLLRRLRDFVEDSDVPRYEVDHRLGYSKGYLSQLLAGTIDLKYRHLIGILDAIGCSPQRFFDEIYPLSRLQRSGPLSPILARALVTDQEVAGVYGFGIEAIHELGERLGRCEETLRDLLRRRAERHSRKALL